MDSNLLAAIVTSACSSASTFGIAVVAILNSNRRMDRIEIRLDKLENSMEMLNGSLNEIDKRLGIIEDRVFNRPPA